MRRLPLPVLLFLILSTLLNAASETRPEALELRNEHLHVQLLPALGGKISSIRDADGFDYLSRSSRPYVEREAGMAFGDAEFDGVDEVWPSMGGGEVGERKLYDHGELWTQAWSCVQEGNRITGIAVGFENDWTFVRTLTLEGKSLRLHYHLHNRSEKPLEGLYAFHPLFTGLTDTRFLIPDETQAWVSWSKQRFLGEMGSETQWGALPSNEGLLKDDAFTVDRDRYWKVFLKPTKPRIGLRYPGGQELWVEWESTHLPYVALWVSEGMKGLHHIAFEPTNSRFDKYEAMLEQKEALQIPAGKSLEWEIILHFDKGK